MEQDCGTFCKGCPLIPENTSARLIGAEVIGPRLGRYRIARVPEVRDYFAAKTRILAEITASTNPTVDVGDTAPLIIDADGKGYEGVKKLINACEGRVPVNALQELFGIRRRCGIDKLF